MASRPVLRYHGGKWKLAEWIIGHFPPHSVYVEPFGGAASVLIQKPRSYSECYNDLDSEVVNVFRVLRDSESAERLTAALNYVDPPYLPSTRNKGNPYCKKGAYRHEMTEEEHGELAALLHSVEGMVVLSGYPSKLYDALYSEWKTVERKSQADGARARREVLWLNGAAWNAKAQGSLLA